MSKLPVNIKKVSARTLKKLIPFSFKKLGDEYLLISDTGRYMYLSDSQFKTLLEDGIDKDPEIYEYAKERCMALLPENADMVSTDKMAQLSALALRTTLHIFVVTGRCNLKCIYCQASASEASKKSLDMNPVVAKLGVDFVFESPVNQSTIEFQGGEPLLNWDTVVFIVEYGKEINKQHERNLSFSLVSNFLLMTKEKLEYLASRKVSLCMSMDGPETLHNKHRGENYKKVIKNYKMAKEIYSDMFPEMLPSLLPTMTKHSLKYAREIVDEFVSHGVNSIFIRPVTSLGFSALNWEDVCVTPEEFEPFYRELFDYLLELNKQGVKVVENQAQLMLEKILQGNGYRYVDLCSPCGATRGQIVYNYDGGIYPCDEARMVAKMGDESFRLGTLGDCTYEDVFKHPVCSSMAAASVLDSLPGCSICVYRPFCGVCPIMHYNDRKDIFTNIYQDRRHKILEITFDVIFEKLKDPENERILRTWTTSIRGNQLKELQ